MQHDGLKRTLREAEQLREAALQRTQASDAAAQECTVEAAGLQASLRERDTTAAQQAERIAQLTRARDDAAASLEQAQVSAYDEGSMRLGSCRQVLVCLAAVIASHALHHRILMSQQQCVNEWLQHGIQQWPQALFAYYLLMSLLDEITLFSIYAFSINWFAVQA